MATVLHRIDSNHFNAGLLSKIKSDVPPDNKHLKVNNLRKILGTATLLMIKRLAAKSMKKNKYIFLFS